MTIFLSRLTTSLTKHGAHKIAWLIRDYDPGTILSRLSGSIDGINIEEAQARNNLSIGADNKVPQVWKVAKSMGIDAIKGLVLISIIFSHHRLISAMRNGAIGKFTGRITRGAVLSDKAYTNFAHIIEELGYSTKHTTNYVDFNLARLFKISGFNALVSQILAMKMRTAGWDGKGDVRNVLLQYDFHEVFATSKSQFESWLSTGDANEELESLEDSDYFLDVNAVAPPGKYKFRAGHKNKKTGTVNIKTPITSKTANLIHNYIQNNLDKKLVEEYGRKCVGCEIPTGLGTFIDVVVETEKFRWFYEIKVAKTIKACIRQAIPQLLEYAYWSEDDVYVQKLIIVSSHELDEAARVYLEKLRNKFDLPLYYEQFIES